MEALTPDDPRHGTTGGYQRHGCRCELCRDHMRRYMADYRRRQRGRLRPDDERHGTINAYQNHGCRCERCRNAARAARAQSNPLVLNVIESACKLRRAERLGLPTGSHAHQLREAVDEYERSQRRRLAS